MTGAACYDQHAQRDSRERRTAAATLVGAGLVKASLLDSAGYLTLAAALVALIWIVCGYILRAARKNDPDPVAKVVSLE